jgi:uncharacterized membrane protein YesL
MKAAFAVYWWALKHTYEELFTIAGVNLVWIGVGVVVPASVASLGAPWFWVGLALFLILLPPPTGGAFYYTNLLAHEKSAGFRDFWEGTKKYYLKSWFSAWLFLGVAALMVTNIWFYGQFEGGWVFWVQALFLSLLIYWSAIQIYVFPMLLEQKEEKLLMAIRNGAILAVSSPLFTLLVIILSLLTFALSVGVTLPAVFILVCIMTLIANRAVVHLLGDIRAKAPEATEEAEASE